MIWKLPTQRELVQELERLRWDGLDAIDGLDLAHLERASIASGFVLQDGADLEAFLAALVDGLKDQKTLARAARPLYGLTTETRGLTRAEREAAAGMEGYGVSQRTMQRKHRDEVHNAVAKEIVRRLTPAGDGGVYRRTIFRNWDRDAWIRKGGLQDDALEPNLDFFSRDLVPLLALPESERLTEDQIEQILVHTLFNYLNFTVQLETKPVNEICTKIHDASFLDWLPLQMKDDALRIYTDEGAHAMMSNNLKTRVQNHTGLQPINVRPQFLRKLDQLKRDRLAMEADFVTLLFVMVSETLITGSLNKLPEDDKVQPAVRIVSKDHANDERIHHAYFSNLLEVVWDRLPRPMRHEAVLLFPQLVRAFLDIDRAATKKIIQKFPRVYPEPGSTLTELVELPDVQRGILASAKPTIALFRRVGVLEEPGAAEAFENAGFVLTGAPT